MTPETTQPRFEELLRPVARESTVSEVAKRLLDQLAEGRLAPGTRLPSERVLAEALDVGRSTVRGALSALDILGIIEIKPGSGSYVRQTTSDLLPQTINWGLMLGQPRTHDLVEVRQFLEVITAQLAATRALDEDIDRLEKHLRRMEEAVDDVPTFVEADVAFHLETAEIARNSVLSDILHSVRSLLQVWVARAVRADGTTATTLAEHTAVFEAIRSRDPEAAGRAMRAHMDSASGRLRRSLVSPEAGAEAS
ncbi:FadR/GntR family transcriptional regulator [Actinoalloteichus caeruleus]|uniref:FadR/GntR family transcriptional regulator n=1 Tax=Actinoalloteichus cyanogriseus TaxID=2893586 RepID=UPI0004AA3B3C|nr:FadR/GntR family transcriptional regulator [Actinoalloteichus caeruleus]